MPTRSPRLSHRLPLLLLLCATTAIAQEVTLPLGEYEALRAAARPPQPAEVAPPAPYALESAQLAVHVGAAGGRVDTELALTVFAAGWQRIGVAGEVFTSADLGPAEGRLAGGDEPALEIRGVGRHRVHLTSVAAVDREETATRPTWRIAIELPDAAEVGGVLSTSLPVEEVELENGWLLERTEKGEWRFAGKPGGRLEATLLGARPEGPVGPAAPHFGASSATLARVSRTEVRLESRIAVHVLEGSFSHLSIPLPRGFSVVSVDGERVAGWEVVDGDLGVETLVPIEESAVLTVRLTGKPGRTLSSPALLPLGAERVAVAAGIAVEGDAIVDLLYPATARLPSPQERAAMDPSFADAATYVVVVADPARPPTWEVTWAEGADVLGLQVDRLLAEILVGESGRAYLHCSLEVRSAGGQRLEIAMPPGFRLAEATRDGGGVLPGVGGLGLAVPLAAGGGTQLLTLAGTVPLPAPEPGSALEIRLPRLSAPIARVEARMLLPPGRAYGLADPARAGAVGRPAPGCAELGAPPGYRVLDAAWSLLAPDPGSLVVEVVRDGEKARWF